MIPRVVSFLVLVMVVLLIGSMFFQVMLQFVVPLLMASVMVVVFRPLHEWFLYQCGERAKIAAALTTTAILVIVMLPIALILLRALPEGQYVIEGLRDGKFNSLVAQAFDLISQWAQRLGLPSSDDGELKRQIIQSLQEWAAPVAVRGAAYLVGTLFGVAIMVISIYYFLVDGPSMIVTLMRLSPLDDNYERELLARFAELSRAVVVATLLSAFVQGLLAGIGYFFALPEGAPIFFLTAVTMLLAMVPFIGSAAVWVPTCVMVYLNDVGDAADNRTVAAIALAVYCAVIVASADNVIKPLVLHGRSNLHPLLALLSVIGGVQVLGPVGILVGPMLVAFFQALLDMLRKELDDMRQMPAARSDVDEAAASAPPSAGADANDASKDLSGSHAPETRRPSG